MTPLDLIIDALAVHRITRLVTRDTITRTPRAAIIRWAYRNRSAWTATVATDAQIESVVHGDDDAPKLATLVTCPWCVSIYAAFLVAASHQVRWARPIRYALALSSIAALISTREDP